MNAIKYFELGIVPKDKPNFRNFDPSNDAPRLIAGFGISQGELSVDILINDLYSRYKSKGLNADAANQQPKLAALISTVKSTYEDLIERLVKAEVTHIVKGEAGNYFFRLNKSLDNLEERKKAIEESISKAKQHDDKFIIGNERVSLDISFNVVENLLFRQSPNIYLFNEQYSLQDSLPDRITNDNISDGSVAGAFIKYLGKERIQVVLNSNNPKERRTVLAEMQNKVDELTNRINQQKGVKQKDLLQIDLSEHVGGLQITVYTDEKPSFYSHISDNTKYLFAYFLHHANENVSGDILLFDEPNNGFHPTAQVSLLDFLQSLAKQNLVIVSTHSEYLIDSDQLSGVRLMSKPSGQSYSIVKNLIYNQPKESGDYIALQPVIDAIGFNYGKLINVKDKVIITEGITNMLYLRAFNTILNHKGELNIAPARSDSHILSLIPLFISQGISFKIVIDTGDVTRLIQRDYGVADDFINEIPIPPAYVDKAKGSGIEDLFTKNDFKNLLSAVGETVGANYMHISNSYYLNNETKKHLKTIVAHYLYGHAKEFDETKFDNETIENFRAILDFCKNDMWFAI